ncbi:Alanine--tRNA ligase, partial [Linderina pennispora]
LKQLPGAELDHEIKRLAKELDAAAIGVYDKHVLRSEFDAIRAAHVEAEKLAKAQAAKQAVELVQKLIEESPEQDVFVVELPAAGKAMSQVATFVKGLKSKAVYLLAVDGARVAHQCVVPKTLVQRGLKAGEWADAVSKIVGGKKGGKDESAQGSGTETARVAEAVAAAQEFAKTHLN